MNEDTGSFEDNVYSAWEKYCFEIAKIVNQHRGEFGELPDNWSSIANLDLDASSKDFVLGMASAIVLMEK